jgi:hypothetical protein
MRNSRNCTNCGTHSGLTRRHFLFGALGATSAALLRTPGDAAVFSANPVLRKTARCCIFINMVGAPSQLDTFDPKEGPWNPRGVDLVQRPGNILLSRRLFPMLSSLTSELCILRSVTSWELAHQRGQFYLETAHSFNPAFAPAMPHVGAVLSYELGGKEPLPPFFSLAPVQDDQRQGFLPGIAAPFSFNPDPGGLANLHHDYYGDQSQPFFNNSYALLQDLDAPLRNTPWSGDVAAYSSIVTQARGLIYNDAVTRIFQFSAADDSRYGGSNFARSLVTARNIVQANMGAVFINTTQDGWDTHAQQFDSHNPTNIYKLTNEFDRGLANLIMDLRASGDLARTLIVALGEFGRTPGGLNNRDGRDHYRLQSALLAGGGIRGGQALGQTDPTGGFIVDPGWSADRPIFIEDIVATMYSAMGVDWTKRIDNTPLGRSYIYILGADSGQFRPIDEVFA